MTSTEIDTTEWERKLAMNHRSYDKALFLRKCSDQYLRLICGELSAQEIRTIRAIINYILPDKP